MQDLTSRLPANGQGIRDKSASRMGRAIGFVRAKGVGEVVRRARQHGLKGSADFVGRNLRHMIAARVSKSYDRRHGTDTAGSIQLEFLTIVGPNQAAGTEAVSTSPKSFAFMMRALPEDLGRFTFIDIGCGKGRTLLLAAAHGFGRVIGVEFASELATVARANLKRFDGHGIGAKGEVHNEDASTYQFPDEPLVVYFYNPFGPEIMQKTLANLIAWQRRTWQECYVVYGSSSNNTISWAKPMIAATGAFESLPAAPMPFYWDAVRTISYCVFRKK